MNRRLVLPAALATTLALMLPVSAAAIAPWEAADPRAGLDVGPPMFQHDRDAARDAARANDPGLAALAQRWGGRWSWRFDAATGRPFWAETPGIPAQDWAELGDDLARSLGPVQVDWVSDRSQGGIRAWVAHQQHDGLPMYGTELALFAQNGSIHAIRTLLFDPPSADAPPGAELWFPDRLSERGGKGWTPARWEEADGVVVVRDLQGRRLARWSTHHPITVETMVEPRKTGDTTVKVPLARVTVSDGATTAQTDATGSFSLTSPYTLTLEGDRLQMRDAFKTGAPVPSWSALSGSLTFGFTGTPAIDPASADTWVHTTDTQDWLEALVPDHAILDARVVATVNRSDVRCNAYYTSGTVNFARPSGSCANTGRLADVVMHEFGHGIHHYGLLAGGFAGDLSEGTADYVAATRLSDSRIGLGFYGGTSILRDIEPDRVYPKDFKRQVHNDGLIWGSFLWNLRKQWRQDYGDELGAEMADRLMLRAMSTGPAMTTVGDATILADDDNGDLSDGTPHGCAIKDLLTLHGLGPGPIGVVAFEHTPRQEAGSYEPGYPLDFSVFDATPACSGLDRASVALWWTTDPVMPEDAADPFDLTEAFADTDADTDLDPEEPVAYTSRGGARWNRLEISETGSRYLGTVPRQIATTRVSYFMEARSKDGTERITTHAGHADRVWSFQVGDRERVWCEGFEGEASDWKSGAGTPWEAAKPEWVDEWTFASPGENLWEPPEAFEGGRVAGTAIGRTYRNLNTQYLSSPKIAVPDEGRMLTLGYARWLTVEDSQFDKAQIYLDNTLLWQQPGTESGEDHTLDRRWTLHNFDVSDRRGQEVQLTWVLRSDPGLEYGGWRLDDICLTRLNDVPGHHRVRDLRLTDTGSGIEVAWTQPWIAPLDQVVVVRDDHAAPTGRDDGTWVWRMADAVPGTTAKFVDDQVEPCATYRYAVFVQGEGVWYEATVEGENLASIQITCEDLPPDDLPDPVADLAARPGGEVDPWKMPETWSCGGCHGGGAVPPALGLLLGLAVVRRRRPR